MPKKKYYALILNLVSFTELLSLDYAGQLDDTAKEYIEYARDGALRMQSLVEDLLEYARLGQDAESREVDLNHVMDDVLSNLKDTIAAVGANIDYAELPVLQANPARLLSVLQNLISNAIKYQLPGTVPRVRLEVKYKRNHWEISVEDNGIGMKEEYCQKIFEPFKRLHAKHKYPGTGMGLAICRRIVESFGGKIWAESRLGEGTIFYFTIPQLQAAA